MTIQTLTTFFMWCTIINGGLLLLWSGLYKAAPNLIYRTQRWWFPISEETFRLIFYGFLGVFKILFLIFNAVPYAALLIMEG